MVMKWQKNSAWSLHGPSACLLQVNLTAVSVSQTCTAVTEIKPIFMNCQALKLFVGECIIPQQPVFVAREFEKNILPRMSFGVWISWTTGSLKNEQIHAHSFEAWTKLNLCYGAQALLMQHFSFKGGWKPLCYKIHLFPLSLTLGQMPVAGWHVDTS